jgi:hypothetical protein
MFVKALAIDPRSPTTVYAGTVGGGVFKSSTGAISWSVVSAGLTNALVYALAIDPQSPTTVYAGTWGGGVFKSSNGAASWSAVNTGLTCTNISALAIDPQSPTTVYAGTDGGGVFKSSDGAASWSAVNTGLTNIFVQALAIDPQNPTTVYAGTFGGGVFRLVSDNIPPEKATLISPSGTISTPTPTYTWNAVPSATWYYLWVNDSTSTKIQTWYTATQAGCASGTGTCSVTPSVRLASGVAQ